MSAFIDQFGVKNGMKFSICQTDFSEATKQIGYALAKKMQNLCMDDKLLDADPTTAGLQADCSVKYNVLVPSPIDPTKSIYQENPQSLPECSPGNSATNLPPRDCWQLSKDTAKCPVTGQLVTVFRTAAEVAAGPLAAGTMINLQCRICSASDTSAGCND
jgi:hypothetical protein